MAHTAYFMACCAEITNVTCDSCLFSWSEPDNGGIPLGSYDVQVKKESLKPHSKRVEWEPISFESISTEKCCYQVTNLVEGETYHIQVNYLCSILENHFFQTPL